MKTVQFTKDVSVERVTPPALLDYSKAVGTGEREMSAEGDAQEFDSEQKAKWRRALFVRYAHRLLECSDKIFADERLFNTPLPLQLSGWTKSNGVYSSQHINLTLGHIIDWWQNYRCAQLEDSDGNRHYIYGFIFGPRGKYGFRPKNWVPDKVLYIGEDGQSYSVATNISLLELGRALAEVCGKYSESPHCRVTFDIEDAIEYLLEERVYQRL